MRGERDDGQHARRRRRTVGGSTGLTPKTSAPRKRVAATRRPRGRRRRRRRRARARSTAPAAGRRAAARRARRARRPRASAARRRTTRRRRDRSRRAGPRRSRSRRAGASRRAAAPTPSRRATDSVATPIDRHGRIELAQHRARRRGQRRRVRRRRLHHRDQVRVGELRLRRVHRRRRPAAVTSSWCTSPTTPTTVRQAPLSASPIRTCAPIGSSAPQTSVAVASEIDEHGLRRPRCRRRDERGRRRSGMPMTRR